MATATINKPDPDYIAAWNDLRSRQRWFFIVWLGFFAAIVLLSQANGFPAGIAFIVWAAAVLYTGYRWTSFPCPRCWEPFFKTSWSTNQFRSTCPHCGFKKYWETDVDKKQPNTDAEAIKHVANRL